MIINNNHDNNNNEIDNVRELVYNNSRACQIWLLTISEITSQIKVFPCNPKL